MARFASARYGFPAAMLALAGTGTALAADPAAASAAAAAAGPPVSAVWVSHKLDFTYMGFTAHFSCDGLRDNVRDILLDLGARKKDLVVRDSGCVRPEGPSPFPRVVGSYSVLVPVDVAAAQAAADKARAAAGKGKSKDDEVLAAPVDPGPLPARWHRVDLVRDLHYEFDLTGNCELLEHIKNYILPQLALRNLDYISTCVPHQATIGGVTFKLDVLVPAPQPSPRP